MVFNYDQQQRENLCKILRATHSDLADIYESAICILDSSLIKDRLRAAAYPP